MEESKALSRLSDATDLLMMLEDIINPSTIERLSQASWSGIRLTLRNARATLQESQGALSKEFVARARQSSNGVASPTFAPHVASDLAEEANPRSLSQQINQEEVSTGNIVNASISNFEKNLSEQNKVQITRRDLKATLEKFIESR